MYHLVVLVTDDETDETVVTVNDYERPPTLIAVETEDRNLHEALTNDYEDWMELFHDEYNLITTDPKYGDNVLRVEE
jgi:hypothetical protein